MATTKQDLSDWFDQGVKQKATHMIVVCDTFYWEDYPVYVKEGQDVKKVADDHGYPSERNMQRVIEVYNLKLDKELQFKVSSRVFNF